MKRAIAIAAFVLLALTGCGVSIESPIKEQAAFKAECVKAGGTVFYDGWGDLRCNFEDD